MSERRALPPSGGAGAPAPSRLRLDVAALTADWPQGFQVLVFVDDVEVTQFGAGLGMDPFDLFVPRNRLAATEKPRRIPIARCECGIYGCGATDVVIARDGELVHWEWLKQKPMEHRITFSAADYDAEVERAANDFGWETPERTAARLVLTELDRDPDRLGASGLRPDWAGNDHSDPPVFRVALRIGEDYQLFVRFPWRDRTPEELAAEVSRTLARGPDRWTATWHAIRRELTGPPSVAGPEWRQERW